MMVYALASDIIKKSKIQDEHILDVKFLFRFLPYMHEQLLNNNMATYKLTEVIKNKIDADNINKSVKISEFEKYISVLMYFENNGKDSKKLLKDFLRSFNRAYIADVVFFNLLSSYYMSTNIEDDEFLIDNIAELYVRINPSNNKAVKKSEIIQRIKEYKKHFE